MSRYYQRPENALKKANEFIEVGKPTRALDTLYDVIKGKKHRAFSEKVIEPIMLKYLELCVDLKKPHTAKEGLYQYRLMCQSVNVGLLEKVIRSFIKMAEERTELARDSLKNKVLSETQQEIVEVDDLDNLSMAEMTLLNVITEEQAQERSDRAALIPWVKFLWESYTQCLDLLRNNARLEKLYHDIAQMAFKFCLSYGRKTEFRKLCERLRKHFDDIVNRASTQMNSIDFSSPETQQLNMETRLSQLDSAITMELWQEAYKAIEDIHLLMNQSRKSQTRMMAYYYQKLSLVFWKAGNLLFHAATLLKYYMLCKDMKKNVSQEELQRNASQVVLATLAIPFPVTHPEFERFVETDKGMLEKSQKLATLLFLPQPPTRSSLIRDLNRYGVLSNAIPRLQDLNVLLETEFSPLQLCGQVDIILKEVVASEEAEYLVQYVEPLQDVALVRLIKQISQVYQSIDYDRFLQLTVFTTQSHLEQLLVDSVRYNDLQITIDHRSNCIRFGSSLAEASREDLPEGPHLQAMPSENVRLQLVNVFNFLEDTIDMINPPADLINEENLRNKIVNHYLMTEQQYHIKILQRQKIIAERREVLEQTAVDRENEEKRKNEQMIKQQQMIEQKRLETEREERERRRIETEKNEFNQRRLMDRLQMMSNTKIGQKVREKLKEDENLDVETFMIRQQEELAKEAKEHLARMRAQEKRIDHMERAKRIVEIPIIEKHMNDKKDKERREWEAHEKERITHLIEERKFAVANRDRMKRMKTDKDGFLRTLLESRKHEYQARLVAFEQRFKEVKAQRLKERKDQRKHDKKRVYYEEKAKEEARREAEIRRIQDEKEREEREKTMREMEEKNRITLEKQLAKERELEERFEKERRMGSAEPRAAVASDGWRAAGPRGTTVPSTDKPPVPAAAATKWVPRAVAQKKAMLEQGINPDEVLDAPSKWREEEKGRFDRERDYGNRDWDKTKTRNAGMGDRESSREIPREREMMSRDREGMGRERDGMRDRDGMGRERDGMRDREGMGRERDGMRDRDGMGRERDGMRDRDGMGRDREGMGRDREGMGRDREGMGRDREMGRERDFERRDFNETSSWRTAGGPPSNQSSGRRDEEFRRPGPGPDGGRGGGRDRDGRERDAPFRPREERDRREPFGEDNWRK